jgi:hypothetical protein
MAATDTATRAGAYAQRLMENPYVQENLSAAVDSLRAAYTRASKRRVEPATDAKVREQVRQAALRLREAADALRTGRTKPKKRRGRRIVAVVAITAGGAAVAIAASDELRQKVFGGPASESET